METGRLKAHSDECQRPRELRRRRRCKPPAWSAGSRQRRLIYHDRVADLLSSGDGTAGPRRPILVEPRNAVEAGVARQTSIEDIMDKRALPEPGDAGYAAGRPRRGNIDVEILKIVVPNAAQLQHSFALRRRAGTGMTFLPERYSAVSEENWARNFEFGRRATKHQLPPSLPRPGPMSTM